MHPRVPDPSRSGCSQWHDSELMTVSHLPGRRHGKSSTALETSRNHHNSKLQVHRLPTKNSCNGARIDTSRHSCGYLDYSGVWRKFRCVPVCAIVTVAVTVDACRLLMAGARDALRHHSAATSIQRAKRRNKWMHGGSMTIELEVSRRLQVHRRKQ